MNITGLPRSRCETFRSIATIENGELLQSKLEKFAILRYMKEDEVVAVTLNKNIQTCGEIMYETGISNVYVVLIRDGGEFLNNTKTEDL